jgi:hypothetical protein
MSQRTIIEVNHDRAHLVGVEDAQRFADALNRAVASGSRESWEPLERWGFKRIVQCHHSDDRKVVTKFAEYPID